MHSHVDGSDNVQLCQINVCLSSVSFLYLLSLTYIHAHTHTHSHCAVPAWEQMKMDMQLMILKKV